MAFSRRNFMKWAASAMALAVPGGKGVRLLDEKPGSGLRPELLPSQKEAWDWLVWMAKLGPKYTGNPAHAQYVDFLAQKLQSFGLDVIRDHYTLDRWEAERLSITVHPPSGASFKAPVTSYYPYSGQTGPEGVTGELVYVGTSLTLSQPGAGPGGRGAEAGGSQSTAAPGSAFRDLKGKVVFLDCPVLPHAYKERLQRLGLESRDDGFSPRRSSARPLVESLGIWPSFEMRAPWA